MTLIPTTLLQKSDSLHRKDRGTSDACSRMANQNCKTSRKFTSSCQHGTRKVLGREWMKSGVKCDWNGPFTAKLAMIVMGWAKMMLVLYSLDHMQ